MAPLPGKDLRASEIEKLRTMLYTDELTNIYNHRFFKHCLDAQKDQTDLQRSTFALIMLRVTDLLMINEKHGRQTGDAVLIQIAKSIREGSRERGWPFRYDGSTFAILLRDSTHDQAQTACTTILAHVTASLKKVESLIAVFSNQAPSLKIGFSVYPQDHKTTDELVGAAIRAIS